MYLINPAKKPIKVESFLDGAVVVYTRKNTIHGKGFRGVVQIGSMNYYELKPTRKEAVVAAKGLAKKKLSELRQEAKENL